MTILKDRAASGVKWSAVSQISRQGIQICTTIVLARVLPPSDFGLLGMATVVIGFIDIFKDLGTTAALIQKKDLSETLLSSVFWLNVGFGMLVMIILFLGAPLGGLFYREPRVETILRVLSLNFFISGLGVLQQALLVRSLAFRALAKTETSAVVFGAVAGIGLAICGAGVWSLVFQSLTTVCVTTIFLWLSSSWRPQWIFDWKEVKSIGSFSINLVGFNIFNYLARNADYLLIGRYLGAQDLGYYTLAYRILLFPIQNISYVIQRVMFPIYSSLQDDNRRFSSAYIKIAAAISLITFPLMMGIFALADPFIMVVFGDEWHTVIPLVMILAPVGLTQSIGSMVGSIYQAKGRADWMFRWGVGAGMIVVFAFIVGLNWGIVGVSVSYLAATFCLTYFNHAIPFRLIELRFSRFIQALFKPFFNSLVMLLFVVVFKSFIQEEVSGLLLLGLSVGMGVLVYFFASWLTNREQLRELGVLIWNKAGMV